MEMENEICSDTCCIFYFNIILVLVSFLFDFLHSCLKYIFNLCYKKFRAFKSTLVGRDKNSSIYFVVVGHVLNVSFIWVGESLIDLGNFCVINQRIIRI